jgi:hypothetical protein
MTIAKRIWVGRRQILYGAALATLWGLVTAVGGHLGEGAAGGVVIFATPVLLSASGSERWQLARGEGDERLRHIRAESAQIILSLVAAVAVIGTLWELGHGHYGPYGVMASVIGLLTFIVPQILRRHR